jgi:hypothetical protein
VPISSPLMATSAGIPTSIFPSSTPTIIATIARTKTPTSIAYPNP